MGYVNNTHLSAFIPPAAIAKSAGAWTPALSGHVAGEARGAADGSFTLLVPLALPAGGAGQAGATLTCIDVYYHIATAADDFAAVELEKMALPANGSAPSGAAAAITLDGAHDTAAKRKTAGDHCLTVTLAAPAHLAADDVYVLQLVIDAAAATVFTLYGARAHFELRL